MSIEITTPFPVFADVSGKPLEDGYIYIGVPNADPVTNSANIYWDASLSTLATQPIRTKGGLPVRSPGVTGRLFINGQYSITVKNKNGFTIFTLPQAVDYITDATVNTIAELRAFPVPTIDGFPISVKGYYAIGDGGGGPNRYWVSGAAPGTYVDNGGSVIVPNGGDGSAAWLWKQVESVDIRDFGAITSNSDNYQYVQASLDYCRDRGGIPTIIPIGIYTVQQTLTFYSYSKIIGFGAGSVLAINVNLPLLKSYQFDILSGSGSSGGVRRFTFKDVTFQGTISAGIPVGTNAQHGVQLYGYGFIIDNLHCRFFGGYGIYSEWDTPGPAPDSGYEDGFVEARLTDIKIYQCGLSGLYYNGPHDSIWTGCVIYANNLKDPGPDKINCYIGSKANPQYINQLHVWGADSTIALKTMAPIKLVNCAIEGASAVQLQLGNGECEIHGGEIFAVGANTAIGIQFVGGPGVCIGYTFDTVIRNCSGGSIDFGTGIDSFDITARIYQTTGSIMLGTLPTVGVGKRLDLAAGGGADNRGGTKFYTYQSAGQNLSLAKSDGTFDEYAQHGGEGVFAIPQRKTEPSAASFPTNGVWGYARANALRFHQGESNTIGAILGESSANTTPADNLDLSLYQTIFLAAAGAPVTITNFTGGLNGSPIIIIMPSSGSEITIKNGTGNILTKTGADLTKTGLGNNRAICFVRTRSGVYFQI